MATAYSTYYDEIRVHLGDYGENDIDGNTQYQYSQSAINAAISSIVRTLSGYSGDGTNISPTVANDDIALYLIYGAAYILAADPNRITGYSESGDISVRRINNNELIDALASKAAYFYSKQYGIGYAKRGALEDAYDVDGFVEYLDSIVNG